MRILLLTPPARQKSSESLLMPPLGLAYVAAALRQAGYQVSIKDGFAEQMSWQDLESFLKEERYYGTRLYQEAKEKNWYQEVCAHNPIDKDLKRPVVLSPQWNEKNLQKILQGACLSFYLDPRYIFKRLMAIRSTPS